MASNESPSEEGTDKSSEAATGSEDTTVHRIHKVSYDVEVLNKFLDAVFHAALDKAAQILLWNTGRVPGYPKSEDAMAKQLPRLTRPQAFYFGTSTCVPGADKKLYNRKSLFCSLHVVVLDDIGTKISRDSLPPDLIPSYIIESSTGNEQWGFILEEPIDDLAKAEVFVSLIYKSGFTDGGGAMPTKLVRLPMGFNMKPGQETMPVKLLSLTDKRFTPDELLIALDTGVTWADIDKDPLVIRQTVMSRTQNAVAWSPEHISSPTLDGIIDPALEWMYTQHTVYQERDEWVDIQCPWSDEHTKGGNDSAGYSPLGWGQGHHRNSRGFNCFHDSCKDRTSTEFVQYVAGAGGPELAIYEHIPELLMRFVYDVSCDSARDLQGGDIPVKITGMRNMFARKIKYATAEGKMMNASPVSLWLSNPARVDVAGAEFNPGCRERLFYNDEDELRFNLFRPKQYSPGVVDQDIVRTFYDYVDYLIPNDVERGFYLDWLACKVQDPTFRGPALFMVAETQGIGRTTLCDIVAKLFGESNSTTLPFANLVKGQNFNAFQESLFVVVNETLSLEDYSVSRRSADILKELIDTRTQRVTINPKYGMQRKTNTYTSYVFLSNHEDGLTLTEGERRYYAIRNAHERNTPEFYTAINVWMKGPEWKRHLWNSLMERDVDVGAMLAPPEASETMVEVIEAARTPLDLAIMSFVRQWPTTLYPNKVLKGILDSLRDLPLFPQDNFDFIVKAVRKKYIRPAHRTSSNMPVDGVTHRFQVPAGAALKVGSDHPEWEETRVALVELDQQVMLAKVIEDIEAAGYDV
jgi:hypothetical protein